MKNLFSTIIIILTATTMTFAQYAQDMPNIVGSEDTEEEMGRTEFEDAQANTTISYNRYAKPVSKNFTGYKVEILVSSVELTETNNIFNQFGGITVESVSGEYSYCIGKFESFNKANDYMIKIIQTQYPTAKIVEYTAGQRAEAGAYAAN